jgi:hypothetical protein
MKEELGLDHYEGRSWRGLHHHALLSMIAFAFLQHWRLTHPSDGKKPRPTVSGPPPHPTLPAVRRALFAAIRAVLGRCPRCHARLTLSRREVNVAE